MEKASSEKNNLENDLILMGYSMSEASYLLDKKRPKGKTVNLKTEELLSKLGNSQYFKHYPKSTLKYLIDEYDKKNRSIIINDEFIIFLKNNIEKVDQELWKKDTALITSTDEHSSLQIYEFEKSNYLRGLDKKVIESYLNSNSASKQQDYRNLIAGFISSCISRTIGAPLDRLKMLYQVNYIGENKPPSIVNGLVEIYKNDGFKGFFKGNMINIIKGSPENGIKLYVFELTKWKLQCKYGEELDKLQLFLCGALSGIISTSVIFPLEVLKLRIAASPKNTYLGISDALVKIYREPRGIINFYSGVEASIFAAIPNVGLNLSVYETLKIFFSGRKGIDNASYLKTSTLMFIGGLSALISSTILYPLQIIQARMIMLNLKKTELKLLNINNKFFNRYKFFRSVYTTFDQEGFKGFYKGYVPGITKIVVGNSISFGIYEKTRILLGVNKKGM